MKGAGGEKRTAGKKEAGRKRAFRLVFFILLALIPIQALASIRWKSATFEEGVHLSAGAYSLTTGNRASFPGYPPITRMWFALPLLVTGVKVPPDDSSLQETYPFEFGTRFLYECNDADRVLFQGRSMVVVLSLLLGIFVFRLSRELFGEKAALFSLFLYTFSPNILAHSRLATPDLPLSAFLFIALYYFRRAAAEGGKRNSLLAALFAFLTFSTKHAGLLLFPALLAWTALLYFTESGAGVRSPASGFPSPRRALKVLVWVILLSLFLFHLEYGFRGTFGSLKDYSESLATENGGKESTLFRVLSRVPILSSIPIPLPRAFLRGLDSAVYYDQDYLHPNWYLGRRYRNGEHWWHYYLVAFALKVPVPSILLACMTLLRGILLWKGRSKGRERTVFLFLPPLVFFLFFSLLCRNQLGLRLILPAFPFLFASTGLLAPFFFGRGWFRRAFVSLLLGWYLVSSVRVFPHYLSYFNELAGGPTRGIEYFADSNLDWGQDLKGLKRYMDQRGIKRMHVRYYGPDGTAEPLYYGIPIPHPGRAPGAPWAISATWFYYDFDWIRPFKNRAPDDRIGYSIFVYAPFQGRLRPGGSRGE